MLYSASTREAWRDILCFGFICFAMMIGIFLLIRTIFGPPDFPNMAYINCCPDDQVCSCPLDYVLWSDRKFVVCAPISKSKVSNVPVKSYFSILDAASLDVSHSSSGDLVTAVCSGGNVDLLQAPNSGTIVNSSCHNFEQRILVRLTCHSEE